MQQMIQAAFSAMSFSSKQKMTLSTSCLGFGATNHVTWSLGNIQIIQPCGGPLQVHTANGENLHIASIAHVPNSLPPHNSFRTHRLPTNQLSIRYLIDNNCSLAFS